MRKHVKKHKTQSAGELVSGVNSLLQDMPNEPHTISRRGRHENSSGRQPLRPRPVEAIENWQPKKTTWPMWLVVGVQLVASVALLQKAIIDLELTFTDVAGGILAVITGWIFADFLSGRYHKYIDAYGDEKTPVFGEIIRQFAHHHRRPKDAIRISMLLALWSEIRFTAPLALLLLYIPMNSWARIFSTMVLAGIAISQHSHNRTHVLLRERSGALKAAQAMRIFLRHRPHMIHHKPPHAEHFEPLNGACSSVLAWLNYNRLEERFFWYLFRAVPRTWQNPELAPPSYINDAKHYESCMARLKFDLHIRKDFTNPFG